MRSQLRIAVCRIMHESNSFATSEVSLSDFENRGGVLVGSDVLTERGRRNEMAGFLNVIERSGENVEVVPLLSAVSLAGGNVAANAVRYFEETLRHKLRDSGHLDGICFALHGSMASADNPDLDGHFLQIVRQEAGEAIPVVVSLDCHAIVTRRMIELASVICGYHKMPHTDIVQTGERAASILLRMLAGEINPVTAWQRIPMILPPPDDGMNSGPLKELFDDSGRFREIDGVVDCSFFASQPWLDAPEQGWMALVVTDADTQLGRRLVRELASHAWELRGHLLPEPMLPPAEAVRAAASAPGHPIIIIDCADSAGAGAPGDTTTLLSALLDQREAVDGLILFHLPDAEAIEAITPADVGATVKLAVGGKRDTRFSRPVTVTGEVLCVTDGVIEDTGGFGGAATVDAGKMVCLGIDNVRLVLTERVVFCPEPSLFRKAQIDPFTAKIVALKTGVGFAPHFLGGKLTDEHIAQAIFRADCPGASCYDLNHYDFTHAQRPLYPLDPDMQWQVDE